MISLLTMGAGNVIVLEETFKAVCGICDEIIYGDLLLFPEDRAIVGSYKKDYPLKVIHFPFDYIYRRGFSAILNLLAACAKNDFVLYLNTSEIIEEDYGVAEAVKEHRDCNAFFFIHRTETHRWFRLYNRKELSWSGILHEQLKGEYRPYHKPVFMMADLKKDMYNPFKASVFNAVKETVYFKQYMKLVENPDLLGETDPGWMEFAKKDYNSFKARLEGRPEITKAFEEGNYYGLMEYFYSHPHFDPKFESSLAIEFQGDEKFLGKTKS